MRRRLSPGLLAVLVTLAAACGRSDTPVVPSATPSVPASDPDSAEPGVTTRASETPPSEADTGPKAANMGWVVLAPERAGFRCELPEEPHYEEKVIAGKGGLSTLLRQWNASDDVAGTFFVVAVAPLVAQLVEFGNAELALDRTLMSITQNGMRILEKRKIQLDGHMGREADIEITAQGMSAPGRVRLYLAGLRLYQLVTAWSDEGGKTQAEKFLASFAFDEVKEIDEKGVDLWRRFPAPGGALDVELPGAPDRSTDRRQTPFGEVELSFITLLSSFPPAVYAMHAIPLSAEDRAAAPASLYDRWEKAGDLAALTGEGAQREAVTVLGGAARRLVTSDGVSRLLFVHDASFYEMMFTPVDRERAPNQATDHERDRYFASPRLHAADPDSTKKTERADP